MESLHPRAGVHYPRSAGEFRFLVRHRRGLPGLPGLPGLAALAERVRLSAVRPRRRVGARRRRIPVCVVTVPNMNSRDVARRQVELA